MSLLGTMRIRNSGAGVAAALLVFAVVAGVLSIKGPIVEPLKSSLNLVSLCVPLLVGAIYSVVFGIRAKDQAPWSRLAWVLLGTGMGLCSLGELLYGLQLLRTGEDPPVGGPHDAVFWCSYLFLIVGFAVHAGITSGKKRMQHMMESFLMCAAGASLLWTFVLVPSMQQKLTPVEQFFSVGYQILAFVLAWIGLTYLSAMMATGRSYKFPILLGLGALIFGLTDNIWTAQSVAGTFVTTSWVDYGWFTSYTLMAVGAMIAHREVSAPGAANLQTSQALSRVGLFAPYCATFCCILTLVAYEIAVFNTLRAGTIITIITVIAILGFRQLLALLEKQSEISSFAETLEQTVIKRTQQLEARYQLAKAVSSTPDIEQFAESAASHTLNVFDCDGIVLAIGPGILQNNPRGIAVFRGFAEEAAEQMGDSIYQPDPLVSTEPLRMLIGDEWRLVTILRVPLRAMNEIYGNLIALRIEETFDFESRSTFESIALEMAAALGHNIQYTKALEASEKDYLTEMLNHRAISRRLQEMVMAAVEDDHIGVLMIDVGGFKLFNDTYGHAAGDDVLRCIAGRLYEIAHPLSGKIGRTGGDEFMVLLPHHSINETYRLAAKIQRAVSEIDFRIAGYQEKLPLEVNIGVASYPESGENPYTILAAADSNLIEAKRNRVTILREDNSVPMTAENRNTSMEAVEMMLTAIDNVDSYTRRHSLDVMKYATWLAEELGSSHGTLEQVTTAALLHDVGKIAVPTSVLRKPGALTDEEYELMKRHTTVGALIVQAMPNMLDIVDGVKYHHERYDGKGYPDGLAGESIPFLGRLLAVADAFSAMTTNRPYRKGMDWPEAARRIQEGIGTQFDPRMAEAFLRVLEARGVEVQTPERFEDRAA